MLDEVNSPAARQMLIYHHSQGSDKQSWTDEHQALYFDELQGALAGFLLSDTTRTVGVSSGRIGGRLSAPEPGEVYYSGTRRESRSREIEQGIHYRQAGIDLCKVLIELVVKVDTSVTATTRSLPLEGPGGSDFVLFDQFPVATSSVSVTLNDIDIDEQDKLVDHFQAAARKQAPTLCDPFITRKIISGMIDELVDDGKKEIDRYSRTFHISASGALTEGAAGGFSEVIGRLKSDLAENGFVASGNDENLETNVFIPFSSALMLSGIDPFTEYTAETIQAASAFDQVYFEESENLYHLESSAGWFAKEVLALFDTE